MLRLLVASIVGLVAFFPIFWLFTWIASSNDIGALVALPFAFVGVPALILKFWRSSGEREMRNRIFGAIGVAWGGAILIFGLLKNSPEGSEAYARGQGTGLVFGGLMLVVGLYYLLRRNRKSDAQQ